MGTFDFKIFAGAVVAAVVASQLYVHFAGRNADAAGAVRVKAAGLLIWFYVVGFALLFMMPSQLAVNPFWYEREIRTVEELVPLLKKQSEALEGVRNTVYWFLLFSLCGFGPAVYSLLKQALALSGRKDDSSLR